LSFTTSGAILKKQWDLQPGAFQNFLRWLDEGAGSDGEKYLEMRRRLVSYFDRRNCAAPDELADETLNRVARKLEEVGQITDASPAHYCYIVAKFVLLESFRAPESRQANIDDLSLARQAKSNLTVSTSTDADREKQDQRMDCLEKCLRQLPPEDQEMIVEYYQGQQRSKIERREKMAQALGISMNALTIRTCRLRAKLEQCVKKCGGEL
jgi:DNA-directed RNA polymerase specialized sigma24 family protein